MAKRLEYEITTDPSKGIQGLKQFSSAVRKSMKDVDDSTEEATTTTQKLAKVLSSLADDIETEMKGAAKAAKALEDALGPEVASRTNIPAVIADVHRLGGEFEDIERDADDLAAALKKVDAVKFGDAANQLDQMDQSTRHAKGGIEEVGKSADSSKSALANMIGNSAQDLGEIGGVAGSAGVAVGQMAEYFADAAFSGEGLSSVLKSFATVLGPIAAITAAVSVFSGVMAENSKRAEESKARVEAFGDASRDVADDAIGIAGAFRDNLTALTDFDQAAQGFGEHFRSNLAAIGRNLPLVGGLVGDAGKQIVDLLPIFDQLGISLYDFGKAIDSNEGMVAFFNETLLRAKVTGQITEDQYNAMTEALLKYRDEVAASDKIQKLWNVDQDEANALFQEFLNQRNPMRKFRSEWETIISDMADGRIETVEAARAINYLHEQLGIDPHEIISIAFDEITKRADENSAAMDKNRDAQQEWRDEQRETADAARDFAMTLDDTQAALLKAGGAFEDMGRKGDAMRAAFDIGNVGIETVGDITDIHDAIRDLRTFISEEGVPNIFDPNDIDVGPFLDKISALREPIQAQIANAFATGGPVAAQQTADAYVTQIVDSLHGRLTTGEVQALLGLTDIEAKIRVAIDQESLSEAQLLLDTLVGLTGQTPYTAEIALGLAAGTITPQEAKILVERQLGDFGIEVPTTLAEPDTGAAKDAADRFVQDNKFALTTETAAPTQDSMESAKNTAQNYFNGHPVTVPVIPQYLGTAHDAGGRAGPYGGVAAERGPEILNGRYLAIGPTVVPPGTRVTSRKRTARILRTRGVRGLRRYDAGGTVPTGPVNVSINAAVVGNRFDVMRAVKRANLDRVRLLGTRSP